MRSAVPSITLASSPARALDNRGECLLVPKPAFVRAGQAKSRPAPVMAHPGGLGVLEARKQGTVTQERASRELVKCGREDCHPSRRRAPSSLSFRWLGRAFDPQSTLLVDAPIKTSREWRLSSTKMTVSAQSAALRP